MHYDHLLVRYGELTLKGTNRKMFVNQLKDNVKRALIPLQGYHVKGKRDRMYVDMDQDADMNEIIHRLTKVYGIKSISPVIKTDKTGEAIYEAAIQLARDFDEGSTFKIDVKRVDKSFHLDTYALQREVGGAILKNVEGVSVNVKQPDHEVRVEIRLDAVYIFEKIIQGSGGLPVGTGGKTLLMLSGGIDSPVAGME
ncbi:tRNA sulfurtransferase, partial [Listeria monocytogenes]|uniref:tRNA sulfurtransferase n=1 Tax=Listeria monocytogenes TaxID=1639 RepID=UPI000BE07339